MKFQLAINMERLTPGLDMADVERHTLEMVQMADEGGFSIAWAAEHHALEMTIAPNPFQILTWWAAHTSRIRLGSAVVVAAYWHPIKAAGEAALSPAFGPDGRLAFTARRDDRWTILTARPDGADMRVAGDTERDYWAPEVDPVSGRLLAHGPGPL